MEQPVLTNPTQGLFIKLTTSATPVYLEGDAGGTNQPYEVFCVGSVAQTIYMPDPTQYFLNLGTRIDVLNNSSAIVTLKGSDGSSITTLPPNTESTITLSAANSNSWVYTNLTNLSLASGILPIANGGTGPSLILPVANGGTGHNANITSQVANTVASWDSNGNLHSDAFIGQVLAVNVSTSFTAATLPSTIFCAFTAALGTIVLPSIIGDGQTCQIGNGSAVYNATITDGINFTCVLYGYQVATFIRINGFWVYDFATANINSLNTNLPNGYGSSSRLITLTTGSPTYTMDATWPSVVVGNLSGGATPTFLLPAANTIGNGTMYRFVLGTPMNTTESMYIHTAGGTIVVNLGWFPGVPDLYRSCILTYCNGYWTVGAEVNTITGTGVVAA